MHAFVCLKLQVDTYATAMTVHILAHHNYNNFYVSYDEETKEYTARRKVPRSEARAGTTSQAVPTPVHA